MTTESPARLMTALSEEAQAPHKAILDWFQSGLGQHVLETELGMLEQLLPGFFGYHLAQFSVQDRALFQSSPIRTRVAVNMSLRPGASLVASPASLPFANDSIDVAILHHLLDFVASPQDVLREIARVTLPMGNLVVVGFNPVSPWGIWRPFGKLGGRAPWTGSFIRPGRLMDWLNLLNFKIDRAQYAIYRPPLARYAGRVRDYSRGFSRNLNLPVGSVYVIVARKRVGAMTPLRPVWKTQRAFGRLSVVRSVPHGEPAAD